MALLLHHRNLISESITDAISDLCEPYCVDSNESGFCPSSCLSLCSEICINPLFLDPPPSPPSYDHPPDSPHRASLSLRWVIFLAALAATATALVIGFYALYVKRKQRRRTEQGQTEETHHEFLDQDHGPAVDHHIWYINTVGLQPSVIDSITVCKYKSGEGLVEGTECSVCLSEFQEDETLRLLPKCSHAFHIPCIDTWLRSHTNCPMCRAPIVAPSTSREPSPAQNPANSGTGEETQLGNSENNVEIRGEMEDQIGIEQDVELEIENRAKRAENWEKNEMQPIRRSVSLDSVSALKISLAVANASPEEFDRNSDTQLAKSSDESSSRTGENRVIENQSLPRLVARSGSMKRSLSCSGKLLLSRNSRSWSRSRSRNSILPP